MNIVSAQSARHWTDEELIGQVYGVGPGNGHLEQCQECRERLEMMQTRRSQISIDERVSEMFLAAQRRAIYARLEKRQPFWQMIPVRRWAAAAAMVCVMAGSAVVYEHHARVVSEDRSDAQLASDVARLSFESESPATDPLKGLFIE